MNRKSGAKVKLREGMDREVERTLCPKFTKIFQGKVGDIAPKHGQTSCPSTNDVQFPDQLHSCCCSIMNLGRITNGKVCPKTCEEVSWVQPSKGVPIVVPLEFAPSQSQSLPSAYAADSPCSISALNLFMLEIVCCM
mmetsp:Transcript_7380/g.13276  ORF Transcript_7380/g.13276 Transcript_7380/m.13276 type:complete len:137 (-) Transcript_7380:111-521(-)